jgi:hypothetical protein
MKLVNTIAATAAVSALLALPVVAQTPGASLNLGPVLPNPGWGTSSTYNVYVSLNGRPVKNARVERWFSGRHGLETAHYATYTNAQGRASFIAAIPRSWGRTGTWVNLNAACVSLGLQQNWRVKQ